VNSRAAVAELVNTGAGPRTSTIVLLATVAMFVRNIALLGIFAPKALLTALAPLFAMACIALLLRTPTGDEEPGKELALHSPISLRRVLFYGILFIAIEVIGTLAHRAFGNSGFMAASAISGLASSASATAASANLAANAKITAELAGTATVIASMASAFTNLPLVFRRLPRRLLLRIVSSTCIQIAVGIVVLAVQHRFFFSRP
jgi:uncharacterized membrane protein (DUF4010 family)